MLEINLEFTKIVISGVSIVFLLNNDRTIMGLLVNIVIRTILITISSGILPVIVHNILICQDKRRLNSVSQYRSIQIFEHFSFGYKKSFPNPDFRSP